MKRIMRYVLSGVFPLILSILLAGCSDFREQPDSGRTAETATFLLKLDIPGLTHGSRAMSDEQEEAIDYGSVHVLVFEETGGGDVFRYQATVTEQSPPTITVHVPKSQASERYRLVVIANMPGQTIANGTPKDAALSQFLFNCLGRWDTSTPDRIPMWGESTTSFVITQDRSMTMLLHRALARVDVGTLFRFNNPNPADGHDYEFKETDKESVWGLDNFRIADIRVYRTRDRAYAATSVDNMSGNEVIIPRIPASALFNSDGGTSFSTLDEADQNPLRYVLNTPGGASSYIREIYIPESSVIDFMSDRDNVPCLVIGGYYGVGNTTDVTYYRADFAEYSNGSIASFRPILRNHRYVFDIRSVSGSGSETPEEALRSVNVDMELRVVEWNEVLLSYSANKNYFFEIANRTVVLDPQAPAGASENSKTVSYSTDLLLDGLAPTTSITYTWDNDTFFSAVTDYANNRIIITALSDNVGPTAVLRSAVLTIEVENIKIAINVSQRASNLDYELDCGSIAVHGSYIEGAILDYSHYITMGVTSRSNLSGEHYELKTVVKNGIYFLADGIFPVVAPVGGVYTYPLLLQGHGTLVNESGSATFGPFDVVILSNSSIDASCTARIVVGYRTKKILTIGFNGIYVNGYMLEPNSASRAFVDASVNFGSGANSTVPMEQNQNGNAFTIEVMTYNSGMTTERLDYNYLRNKLETFQPDIILTGQAINYYSEGTNTNAIGLLADFVDAGGVFVMCNEYYPSLASVNSMVSRIMGSVNGSNQSIGVNQLFSLASGDAYADDLILNGPFGDMRGRQWGADGHEMHGFTNLPAGTVIYSTRTDGAVCMFRHETKGFFFMGEGGFISNSGRYIGNAYQGSSLYFPFAIDAQYRPIPRINYTSTGDKTVYNSQIFGNILTWAVNYAETH